MIMTHELVDSDLLKDMSIAMRFARYYAWYTAHTDVPEWDNESCEFLDSDHQTAFQHYVAGMTPTPTR